MRMLNEFPEHRRADPRRQAEMQVYDQLAGSGAPGAAIYEIRAQRDAPEVDFMVWLQDSARFGMQVKGGRYTIEGGRWFLHTNGEREPMQDPVKLTWDAAMSIRAALWTQGGTRCLWSQSWSFRTCQSRTRRSRNGLTTARSTRCGAVRTWSSG